MAYLLDTNVISETRKARKSEPVMSWLAAQSVEDLWTSTVNIAELLYGAELLDDIIKRRALQGWVDNVVRPWLHDRVAGVSETALFRWRLMIRKAQLAGQRAPEVDLLIAAVAFENNLTVATRDVKPFLGTGVTIFNPFTGERFNGA